MGALVTVQLLQFYYSR